MRIALCFGRGAATPVQRAGDALDGLCFQRIGQVRLPQTGPPAFDRATGMAGHVPDTALAAGQMQHW